MSLDITPTDYDSADHDGLKWLDDIACVDVDITNNPFFVRAGNSLSPEHRAMCQGCPVREQCTMHGFLPTPKIAGYFGATSPSQRRRWLAQTGKDPVAAAQLALEWVRQDTPRP